MPFIAKAAMPCDPDPGTEHQAANEAAKGGRTLFSAPAGYFLSEGLMAALRRHGRRVIWTRLGPEDRDPGVLLVSLIAAARRAEPGFGSRTMDLMRAQPGPVAGWPGIFGQLAGELRELLQVPGALVLEDTHHLLPTPSTLELLSSYLLPALPDQAACIIIISSRNDQPPGRLPPGVIRRSARDLRLAEGAVSRELRRAIPGIPGERLRQAAALCQGQAALVAAIRAAWRVLGVSVLDRGISASADTPELLEFLARAWLSTVDVYGRRALGLAVRLGYSHPALTAAAVGEGSLPLGPWVQVLSDDWLRLRPIWNVPLRRALTARALPGPNAVSRAAGYLLEIGAVEQAIQLYLELGDTGSAARALAHEADRFMDLGQWETMSECLGQLPDRALREWPWLMYHQAELTAVQGHAPAAQRRFAAATSLFVARHELRGACQSALAESALAADRLDLTAARAHSLAASAMADAVGNPRCQVWAAWQLGTVALQTDNMDDAAVSFCRAAEAAAGTGEPAVLELTSKTEQLAGQLQEVRRRREEHYSTYLGLEAEEQAATERLITHVGTAHERAGGLVQAYGWSHTPLTLRLPALPETGSRISRGEERVSWWSRTRKILTSRRAGALRAPRLADGKVSRVPVEFSVLPVNSGVDQVPPGRSAAAGADMFAAAPHQRPKVLAARPASERAPLLTAHVLGSLQLALNDLPLDHWPSGRGRAVLKYLLTHRGPWPTREVLMEVFWPHATPEAARNNLNVALHGLRRTLRTASDVEIVILEHGAYRLHPDVRLWLDVDEFERHVRTGRQLDAAGELAGALSQYELAAALYQGDFLADDPYEEWPIVIRESLRLTWLDMAGRLSHIYLSRGQYASCANLCQRILNRDPCREDAHRRLMRCYSRQGQVHLALRQYRVCTETLRAELGVNVAPETIDLYKRIHRRESV